MKERPIWLIAGILLLVSIIALKSIVISPPPDLRKMVAAVAPSNAVKITIASSYTKEEWLRAAVEKFNAKSKTAGELQVNGKPVLVEVIKEEIDGKKKDYRSGTMVADTIGGKIKPTVISPAEESWIEKLNNEWKGINGKPIVTGDAPPLAFTPIVLAMWQSRAEKLGCWPEAGPNCTWQTLRTLATNPNGWEMLGKPEWGKFKLGYGYMGESNSGTLSVALMCMIGAGKTSGLTLGDVDPSNGCGEIIGAIEKAKFHSGKSSDWLFQQMSSGPEYLDAVISYESDVIAYNRNLSTNLREPFVAVYPQDGTVIAGHPYVILDGAPWVTGEQVEAAKLFRTFLLSREQQEAVMSQGLRPADPSVKIGPPIETRYGVNPGAKLVTLEVPNSLVMDRITEVWHKVKKHSDIVLVFDKSGSMQGEKLNAALAGAKEFIGRMDGEDWLMWMPFDDRIYTSTQGKKSEVGERLIGDIGSTVAGNSTSLYDATIKAYDLLESQRKTSGDTVRYGIVILSDGQDTASKNTLSMLQERLRPSESDPAGIQIHTVAIGKDADENVLKKIANSGHGKFWKGQSQQDLVSIYKEIASYY